MQWIIAKGRHNMYTVIKTRTRKTRIPKGRRGRGDTEGQWEGGGAPLEGTTSTHVLESLGDFARQHVQIQSKLSQLLRVQGIKHLTEVTVDDVLGRNRKNMNVPIHT